MNRPPMETEGSEASIGDFESPRSHVMPPGYYGDGTQNIEDPSVSSPIIYKNLQMVKKLFSLTIHIIYWLFCFEWTFILQAFRGHSSPAPCTGAGKIRVVPRSSSVSLLSLPDFWSSCCRLFSCYLKGRWIILMYPKGRTDNFDVPCRRLHYFWYLKVIWIILWYPLLLLLNYFDLPCSKLNLCTYPFKRADYFEVHVLIMRMDLVL